MDQCGTRGREGYLKYFFRPNFITIIQRYYRRLDGKYIRLVDPSGDVEGEAIDLDDYGGLNIQGNSGFIVKRISGDVVQVHK